MAQTTTTTRYWPLYTKTIPKSSIIVLGFDVERLGSPTRYSTIEVAASVVSKYPQLELLDQYSHSEYRSEKESEVHYRKEDDCMINFWKDNLKVLEAIEKDTPKETMTIHESRSNMILGFVEFLRYWQVKHKKEEFTLEITTDNKLMDGWTINTLIDQFVDPSQRQQFLPYSFTTEKRDGINPYYQKMFETESMMWGFLMGKFGAKFVDRKKKLEDAFRELYDVVPFPVVHDHRSKNDAYHAACTFQMVIACAKGDVPLRAVNLALF
jgi:hypothetical protein